MLSFKSNHKIIKAADYSDFMTSAFSSAVPALNYQILFLHRVNGNLFYLGICLYSKQKVIFRE